jgi:hypothetical protein
MNDEKILELAAQFDDDSPEFAMSTEAVIAFARALIEARLAEDGDEPFLWIETEDGELNWDNTCIFSDTPAFMERPLPLYLRPPQNSESKYKDAIQNCIDMAGGRESEWGPIAESAFAFLYIAIDGGEEE